MNAAELYARVLADSSVAPKILSVSLMLIAGFLMTRITKRLRLPNVTAYIVAGILLGPFALDLVPDAIVQGTDFLPDIALAFIAFGTGEFFRAEVIRKNGLGVIIITILECLLATVLVFLLCTCVFGLSFPFSLVLAALAAATAPTSTMMTIRQVHAKGPFVDTLLQVVAMDDIVGLVAYSVAISVATAVSLGHSISFHNSFLPFLLNIAALLLGAVFGLFIMLFMKTRHSTDNRLIIAVTMLLTFCGICSVLNVSPLLGCMAMGAVYINTTGDEGLFKQLGYFSPPILMLFFVRSGISFDLGSLLKTSEVLGSVPLFVIGVGYFFIRILGKYAGANLGCRIVKTPANIRKYLGLALIPQASVAIGLAEMGARTLGGDAGRSLQTIILASSVINELVGPAIANASLYLSHSYSSELEDITQVEEKTEDGSVKPPVELLIERIEAIQEQMKQEQESQKAAEDLLTEDLSFDDLPGRSGKREKKN